jgi:hypothetical protein
MDWLGWTDFGLGIGGGPLGHGSTFAQADFSVKVMRHTKKIKFCGKV